MHAYLHVFNRIFQSPLYIQILTFPNLSAILYKCHFHSLLINCRRQLYFYSRLVWLIGKLHFGSKYDLRHKNSLLPWYTYFPYIFFSILTCCAILQYSTYCIIPYHHVSSKSNTDNRFPISQMTRSYKEPNIALYQLPLPLFCLLECF